jgi:hypothetical protein
MVSGMWISRAEYENLKGIAKNNEHDADTFRRLIEYIKEKKTVVHNDFVLVSYDVWGELTNKFSSEEDKVKDIQAELEWYKVKYHDMKMNAEQ